MNEEKIPTRVIFKMTPKTKYHQPECIAFLLDVPANKHFLMSYMHIGQHDEAYIGFYKDCRLATAQEYKDLYEELESLGYVLSIRFKYYPPTTS